MGKFKKLVTYTTVRRGHWVECSRVRGTFQVMAKRGTHIYLRGIADIFSMKSWKVSRDTFDNSGFTAADWLNGL